MEKPKFILKRRTFALILSLCFFTSPLWASYPLIRNFVRSDYDAGRQNWDIIQDDLGRMYFANNHGLLCFDGNNWNLSRMNNQTTVRCLHIDPENQRIYVGGSEDFGYFYHDPDMGVLRYQSLIETIDRQQRSFHEVWNIHQQDYSLWFQSDFKLFRFDGNSTQVITSSHKITTSSLIDGQFYIGSIEHGVSIVRGKELIPLPQNEILQNKRICAIIPSPSQTTGRKSVLIVTTFDGIYLYDGKGIAPYPTDIDSFLKENQVFCAAANDKDLVFGTVDNGIVIKNTTSGRNTFINRYTGLQNNTVLSIAYDRQNNLWLGLDNGISCVLQNSPIKSLLGNNNPYGAGYASLMYKGTLFLGTNQGLYATTYPTPSSDRPLYMPYLLKGQVWSIDTIGQTLFVGNDNGLYQFTQGSFHKIAGIPGTWSVTPLRKHPGYALASTYQNIFLLKKENSGTWACVRKISGYEESGGRLFEDEQGYLWHGHWMKGIFRLLLSDDMTHFSERPIYNRNRGLPTDYNNALCTISGQMVVSTSKGFYRYNLSLDSMLPDVRLNERINTTGVVQLHQSPKGNIWYASANHVGVARRDSQGKLHVDSTTYKSLAEKLIPGFENFNFIDSTQLIVSGQDGFYEVNTLYPDSIAWMGRVFINRIYATGTTDSLIYTAGNNTQDITVEVPYRLNSLRFEFVLPEYRIPHAIQYSCFLENYDDEWNTVGQTPSKEYTRLKEGVYTLHVKARNIYNGSTSSCSIRLRVTPPWYRSLYAKVTYILIALFLLVGLFFYLRMVARRTANTFALQQEKKMAELKRHAEEEALRKDYEIANLKSKQLEHDIKFKSQELSNITMNVMRKNEILIDISEQLSKLKESKEYGLNAAATKQLSVIHQHIQENISHDNDWQNFSQHFDVVYDDFLKRLLESFPKLTNNDLRICAYLKMGLSSKDIAPLLNISYRSVEMSRYRLRAKLGLERDTNLMGFLQQF